MTQSEKQKNISNHLFQDGQKQPLSEVALTYSVTYIPFSSLLCAVNFKKNSWAFRGGERKLKETKLYLLSNKVKEHPSFNNRSSHFVNIKRYSQNNYSNSYSKKKKLRASNVGYTYVIKYL